MPRLFLGLELPASVKAQLLRVAGETSGLEGARWQSAGQLHLTLVFLGEVADARLPEVVTSLEGLSLPMFDLDVCSLGCFGSASAPHNLWAGIEPEEPLAALHHELRTRLEGIGFAFESRRFRPHITLARFHRRRGSVEALLGNWRGSEFGAFPAEAVSLFQSKLRPDGSEYSVIERFPLNRPVRGEEG
ncbi:RNA 2',3'-cyclic phosphodiesterase [Marinobacter salinexigens]|uniref:RNA 2',3'-cyclic phosphodiesterase n=1 Tax=Marinobacter salinexigens TaxID=2919747 RepID=A0A5B0VBL6_9GAMM|nr:RNA 2',3'-cyclic phosphodiesterase [Marinobacter salinexigens]KAA1171922.1 RNA 2',3'-cyclic phosphodiesterase [Marinobacter salinexigens]